MSGFAIFNIDVKKPEEYKEYVEKVKPIAEKFGGDYIIRGGETKIVEGNWSYPRTVVIKFPSFEKALAVARPIVPAPPVITTTLPWN